MGVQISKLYSFQYDPFSTKLFLKFSRDSPHKYKKKKKKKKKQVEIFVNIWDPMGVKISKGYSSYNFFLNVLCDSHNKSYLIYKNFEISNLP